MVYRTAVRADGTLPLGDVAQRLGYAPGTPVDVIVTSAGSLLIAIDDTPALDVPYSVSLATVAAHQKALREQEQV